MRGEKKQFSLGEVEYIDHVVRDISYSVKEVYAKAKLDENVNIYLPDYAKTRLPNRKFLFNIINTVYKGSVLKMV